MNPKSIFSVAVRLLGLVFLFRGLSNLPDILTIFSAGSVWNFINAAVALTWPFIVAYWLIRGAPLVVHTAYPDSEI
jgi:hypothetical protein